MNKNSDKVLKRQLEHKISKLDKEIDIVQDRELPNLENKIFQAEGIVIFFYGIVLGLCLNLISNIISEFVNSFSKVIQIGYAIILTLVTIYLLKTSLSFFNRTYLKPARNLRNWKVIKRIYWNTRRHLKRLGFSKNRGGVSPHEDNNFISFHLSFSSPIHSGFSNASIIATISGILCQSERSLIFIFRGSPPTGGQNAVSFKVRWVRLFWAKSKDKILSKTEGNPLVLCSLCERHLVAEPVLYSLVDISVVLM